MLYGSMTRVDDCVVLSTGCRHKFHVCVETVDKCIFPLLLYTALSFDKLASLGMKIVGGNQGRCSDGMGYGHSAEWRKTGLTL
jgi:hypothetical protein